MLTRAELMRVYKEACEVELQAFKPGNVSVYSAGHDMTVDDFRISASVSAEPITNPDFSLGERIFYAVQATRSAVACNTNLGIILLCAPLLLAAEKVADGKSLQECLNQVLENTSRQDADWVFRAIVLASPGGLGESDRQDVRSPAAVTLTEAMALAAQRDRIALQYVNGFKDLFDFAVFRYNRAFVWSGESSWAALAVFAELLANYPDSHVERKYGEQYSEWIAAEMAELLKTMEAANEPTEVLPLLQGIDKAFKAKNINPGTSADLTVATVLVVLLAKLVERC
ncbi:MULTISPECIES: triphosphoribosyl-dephospho-CoA synthase [Methylomonas]|uniref:triphosphoribosyl-dephospho-CoA synthase n=1 Tax=Methylomonas TaxID=416 RepID=UPI001231B041|nr:triphosphoribosyl-dephospho-CoA synthase [Methylomonas rhizoryzae]